MAVTIRDLRELDDYRAVVELERAIWEYSDLSDVVTVPVFIITVKRGGILIGAFDDAAPETMVGFAYSIVGMKDGRPTQWSHMMGVLPAYRKSGVGRMLKLVQRERAIAAGFDLMEWTFDPLQALNAHLNFSRLGVVAEEYVRNLYGDSTSALHKGTPTDRLIVQWRLREPHVERRIRNANRVSMRASEAAHAPTVNPTRLAGAWHVADSVDLGRGDRRVWVEVPSSFTEMQRDAPDVALQWRMQTRSIFERYFEAGYRAVDFEFQREERRGRYLLSAR